MAIRMAMEVVLTMVIPLQAGSKLRLRLGISREIPVQMTQKREIPDSPTEEVQREIPVKKPQHILSQQQLMTRLQQSSRLD